MTENLIEQPLTSPTKKRPATLLHSIIIPIYNDQDVIRAFYQKVRDVFNGLSDDFELIYVDDASKDRTFSTLMELHEQDPRVKILRLSRNFGHQVSILAGLDYAKGDTFITMDGDLQHPPDLLPTLIDYHRKGYDVIYTTRLRNESAGHLTRFLSGLFYKVFNSVTKVEIDPGSADFRLFGKKAADTFRKMREVHRFNRGLVAWIGFKQIIVPYTADPRVAGESKFNVKKRLRLAFDGIFSFSTLPLRLASYTGLAITVVSFLYGIFLLSAKFFGKPWPAGWTTIAAGMMFFGGLQLFFLGLIGEYIGRVYEETKKRPLYVEDVKVGFDD